MKTLMMMGEDLPDLRNAKEVEENTEHSKEIFEFSKMLVNVQDLALVVNPEITVAKVAESTYAAISGKKLIELKNGERLDILFLKGNVSPVKTIKVLESHKDGMVVGCGSGELMDALRERLGRERVISETDLPSALQRIKKIVAGIDD